MKRVEIGYQTRKPRWDFGIINDPLGKIKIDPYFWKEYVKARYEYEILHQQLIEKIPKKHIKKWQKKVK